MSLQPALRRVCTLLFSAILLAASTLAQAQKSYTVTTPDGVTLAVQEAGNPDGPAIVFIHGLLGSRINWDAQVNSPLLQRYRMITYDLRGHGLSGKPSDARAYTDGNRWADDLDAVIKASDAKRPVLAGWSLGGVVMSNYLARYGDSRISGALYINGVIELKPEQIVAHPEIYRDLNSPDLETHLDTVREFLALCFHTRPDTQTFERLFANAAMASWDMQQAVQSMTVEAAKGLGNAKVPVLLLYGARDALVQVKPSIARATQLNPRVKSMLYENSGHAPFIEETERFNRDLSAFIDSTSVR
ncbi:alpha/beta fold hydrolase [Pseudomonas capsici]|uniref:alpha/beta fold hydrolase n=1 Tax=Pseudomonas capsici TaxID=2810614 RepID=UPI0021F22595|nr:alpha/beta hydrolase [Pseudomonas capsici]MCV4283693.1 alpha/beta hydrolase [Pseudomonas capsici]